MNPATGTATGLPPEALKARIAALGEWFHNIELDGVATAPHHPLGDYPRVKWQRFAAALPARLDGRTVLDVGCNGGFYAMEMKRRGAARVLGIDSDRLFPVEGQHRIARSIRTTLDEGAVVLSSDFGHDGFLIESNAVGAHLRRLLDSPPR